MRERDREKEQGTHIRQEGLMEKVSGEEGRYHVSYTGIENLSCKLVEYERESEGKRKRERTAAREREGARKGERK